VSNPRQQKPVSKNLFDVDDLKMVWRLISKNLLILILIPTFCAFISYFYTHKLTQIYGAKTQVLLKQGEIYDYQNPLYKGLGYYGVYGDISNQIRVLQSHDLIQKAIEKLNFKISYYIIGRIKTTE